MSNPSLSPICWARTAHRSTQRASHGSSGAGGSSKEAQRDHPSPSSRPSILVTSTPIRPRSQASSDGVTLDDFEIEKVRRSTEKKTVKIAAPRNVPALGKQPGPSKLTPTDVVGSKFNAVAPAKTLSSDSVNAMQGAHSTRRQGLLRPQMGDPQSLHRSIATSTPIGKGGASSAMPPPPPHLSLTPILQPKRSSGNKSSPSSRPPSVPPPGGGTKPPGAKPGVVNKPSVVKPSGVKLSGVKATTATGVPTRGSRFGGDENLQPNRETDDAITQPGVKVCAPAALKVADRDLQLLGVADHRVKQVARRSVGAKGHASDSVAGGRGKSPWKRRSGRSEADSSWETVPPTIDSDHRSAISSARRKPSNDQRRKKSVSAPDDRVKGANNQKKSEGQRNQSSPVKEKSGENSPSGVSSKERGQSGSDVDVVDQWGKSQEVSVQRKGKVSGGRGTESDEFSDNLVSSQNSRVRTSVVKVFTGHRVKRKYSRCLSRQENGKKQKVLRVRVDTSSETLDGDTRGRARVKRAPLATVESTESDKQMSGSGSGALNMSSNKCKPDSTDDDDYIPKKLVNVCETGAKLSKNKRDASDNEDYIPKKSDKVSNVGAAREVQSDKDTVTLTDQAEISAAKDSESVSCQSKNSAAYLPGPSENNSASVEETSKNGIASVPIHAKKIAKEFASTKHTTGQPIQSKNDVAKSVKLRKRVTRSDPSTLDDSEEEEERPQRKRAKGSKSGKGKAAAVKSKQRGGGRSSTSEGSSWGGGENEGGSGVAVTSHRFIASMMERLKQSSAEKHLGHKQPGRKSGVSRPRGSTSGATAARGTTRGSRGGATAARGRAKGSRGGAAAARGGTRGPRGGALSAQAKAFVMNTLEANLKRSSNRQKSKSMTLFVDVKARTRELLTSVKVPYGQAKPFDYADALAIRKQLKKSLVDSKKEICTLDANILLAQQETAPLEAAIAVRKKALQGAVKIRVQLASERAACEKVKVEGAWGAKGGVVLWTHDENMAEIARLMRDIAAARKRKNKEK